MIGFQWNQHHYHTDPSKVTTIFRQRFCQTKLPSKQSPRPRANHARPPDKLGAVLGIPGLKKLMLNCLHFSLLENICNVCFFFVNCIMSIRSVYIKVKYRYT